MKKRKKNPYQVLQELQESETTLDQTIKRNRLVNLKFLPSQQKFLTAYNDPRVRVVLLTAANQTGKSFVLSACLFSTLLGFQPWDNYPRRFRPPVQVALLLRDYDNHGRKFLEQNVLTSVPSDIIKSVDKTQQGAPRKITLTNGSQCHIYTHDQDRPRLEGGTWHELYIDEPAPHEHVIALQRGLQASGGKTLMTMTPLSEPWIYDEYYLRAGNLGGDRHDVHAITAFPDENLQSKGGHLIDEEVQAFRESLTDEEKEARVYGRWRHLIGRVHKTFEERIHVIESPLEVYGDAFGGYPHGITVDPHDRKPFAIGWWAITPENEVVFYDEWPTEPWEKCRESDKTIPDYASMFLDTRRHRPIWWLMDPHFGATKRVTGGALSTMDMFALCGCPFRCDFNSSLAEGHKAVQDRLKFDREKPLSPTNRPRLFISRNCRNIIKSLLNYTWDNWTGRLSWHRTLKEKPREQWKDFADVVRYTCIFPARYFDPGEVSRGQRGALDYMPRGWQGRSSLRAAVLSRRGQPETGVSHERIL